MAKTKISISLIKKGIPIGRIMKNPVSSLQLPEGKTLYYKNNHTARPKWLDNFFGEDVICDGLLTKSASAVILYELNVGDNVSRIFAVCFGFGKSLLENNVVEKRFGLLVTLNCVDADKLRSVDINSMEAVPLNNRIQSSSLSSIRNFNIDVDKDLLKSVTGSVPDGQMKGTLAGSDSLSISTDKKYDEMDDLLRLLYELYKSNDYQNKGFDWVNQIQAIKDTAKIDELNNRLVQTLNSDHPEQLWTSIPEIVNYNMMDTFRLKSDTVYDDISLDILKEEYSTAFTLKNLKSRKVECLNGEGTSMKSWSVYRCLYADFTIDDHQYLLNDGKWFEVDLDYVRCVKQYYENIPLSDIAMLPYQWREEKDYNKAVCDANSDQYFLMDRDLIRQGGSSVEFCDIYTHDRKFVHVKKYNGSSVLSHLFFQGLVSAENFLDKDYRRKVNEKLSDSFHVPDTDSVQASDYEVVFAIAKDNVLDGERPKIPFFSMVSFRSVASRLKKYGYQVSIKGINIPNGEIVEGGNEQ